jgi:hypothetical protein
MVQLKTTVSVCVLYDRSLDSWDGDSCGGDRGAMGGHPPGHTLRDATANDGQG